MKQFTDLLSRIPFIFLAMLACGYFAYDYYDFINSNDSLLGAKKSQLAASKVSLEASRKKLATAEEFFKNLDAIRTRIRSLSQQLDNSKASLSGDIDLANFIRMVTLEAKKVGLTIKGIKPEAEVKKEYYVEVPFNLQIKGAYVQVLVFFDRIIRLQQLVRISGFSLKPVGNTYAKFVDLEGEGNLHTYKYLGSGADDVTKQDWMKGNEEGLRKLQDAKKQEGHK